MAKKIFIHLGLPKTATTSLQKYVFLEGDSIFWKYFGVRQPRTSVQSDFYTVLMSAVSAPNSLYDLRKNNFKKCLKIESENCTLPLFVSEEMFCVDGQVSWQEKIKRLGELFADFEVHCIITTRNPLRGVFSIYVELYHSLRYKYSDFDEFLHSNQSLIFDYKFLVNSVQSSFGDNLSGVLLLPFELLGCQDEFFRNLGRFLGVNLIKSKLPVTNKKSKSTAGVTPSAIPVWRCAHIYFKSVYESFPILGRLGMRIAGLFKWLPFENSWMCQEIPFPEEARLKAKYKESNEWLFENYNINYI